MYPANLFVRRSSRREGNDPYPRIIFTEGRVFSPEENVSIKTWSSKENEVTLFNEVIPWGYQVLDVLNLEKEKKDSK